MTPATSTASTRTDDPNLSTPELIVNPSPRTIYLVRHGETQGNIDDKAQGHLDVPLTETGRLQAKAVAERLSDIEFDAVYSSDLQRAIDTAKAITAHRPELQIQTRSELREYHFGDYEDMPWDEIGNTYLALYRRWKNLSTRLDIEFPGGESMRDAWERVGGVLREILSEHQQGDETILIVGHGGSLQAVLAHLLNLSATNQWFFIFDNTSVTRVREHQYTPNAWRTHQFNDTSHLNGIGRIDRSKR